MRQKKSTGPWFKLDNAGKLYPSIASSRVSTTFRLTAVLNESVNARMLQKALGGACNSYPLFNVILRRGAFWYYFERTSEIPQIHSEKFYPCNSIRLKESHARPFSLLYYKNKVHLEISHAISDGAGAMTFLKQIIKNYYHLKNNEPISDVLMMKAGQDEDAFKKYYEQGIPNPNKTDKAFHFPFKLIDKGEYRITTGIFSYSQLKEIAKKYNTSPTKFLLLLFFETVQDYLASLDLKNSHVKPIIINLPVDLRSYFPSETVRNFFISLTPQIDTRLGFYTREEILNEIDMYFSYQLNIKRLRQYIHRNFRNELFWHIRIIPLFIKNAIIPWVYNYYGESSYTTSLSNLGITTIDEPYGDLIERLEVLPPPSEGNIIKATMMTYRDVTALSFGSLTDNRIIERQFFRALRKEGLNVKIETNYA